MPPVPSPAPIVGVSALPARLVVGIFSIRSASADLKTHRYPVLGPTTPVRRSVRTCLHQLIVFISSSRISVHRCQQSFPNRQRLDRPSATCISPLDPSAPVWLHLHPSPVVGNPPARTTSRQRPHLSQVVQQLVPDENPSVVRLRAPVRAVRQRRRLQQLQIRPPLQLIVVGIVRSPPAYRI
ncbi:hypothetical protein ACLOJK_038947 [Asimina triloba]